LRFAGRYGYVAGREGGRGGAAAPCTRVQDAAKWESKLILQINKIDFLRSVIFKRTIKVTGSSVNIVILF
jgi:hypothetical protein